MSSILDGALVGAAGSQWPESTSWMANLFDIKGFAMNLEVKELVSYTELERGISGLH
jgi:hypothetical protein